MKRVKNIIFILALCFQFIAIKPVQPTQAEADFNLLKNTLNAKIHENKSFIASKTKGELARIVVLSEQALSDPVILQRYASALSLSPSKLKSVISELAQKSAATPKKSKAKTVAPSLKKGKAKTVASSLKKGKAKKAAPSLKKDKAKKVASSLKKNKAKKAAPSLKSDPIVTSAILKKAITTHKKQNCYRVKSKNKEIIQKQSLHYSLYITLDVPERNNQETIIDWQVPIDYLLAHLRNTQFTFDDSYRHITLAWFESTMPFTNESLTKVKKAISHAHEILKIVYQTEIPGISLLDGLLLGKGKKVIAFEVAESKDIKIIQNILLKFIAFEGIDTFKLHTFEEPSLLHVTLGRIKGRKPSNLEAIVQSLRPPQASRKSLGKSLIPNTFRVSYTSEDKNEPRYELGEYAF